MVHYYGYNGIKYNVFRLWEITEDNPIIELDMVHLKGMLASTPWRGSNGTKIGPRKVIKQMKTSIMKGGEYKSTGDNAIDSHAERINEADLDYPILVELDFSIIDGFHRMAKAMLEDNKKIYAKVVTPEQLHQALLENDTNATPRFLYHSSINKYTSEVDTVHSRKFNKPIVFASPYQWMALVCGGENADGKRWTNKDIDIKFEHERGRLYPLVREVRSGALEEYFNRPQFLHVVKSKSFTPWDGRPSYAHYISDETTKVIEYELIEHPLDKLREVLGHRLQEYSQ